MKLKERYKFLLGGGGYPKRGCSSFCGRFKGLSSSSDSPCAASSLPRFLAQMKSLSLVEQEIDSESRDCSESVRDSI